MSVRTDGLNTTKIEITDFTYDLEGENFMNCYIELTVEGDEIVEELDDDRECDDNPLEKEIEIPRIEDIPSKKEERKEEVEIVEKEEYQEEMHMEEKENTIDTSLFLNIKDENETFGTFLVYIVRQNESIHSIIEKYHTTLEDVEQYNDISNIEIGSKLIIPLKNE